MLHFSVGNSEKLHKRFFNDSFDDWLLRMKYSKEFHHHSKNSYTYHKTVHCILRPYLSTVYLNVWRRVQVGVVLVLPHLTVFSMSILAGFLGDRLAARVSVTFSRKFFTCVGAHPTTTWAQLMQMKKHTLHMQMKELMLSSLFSSRRLCGGGGVHAAVEFRGSAEPLPVACVFCDGGRVWRTRTRRFACQSQTILLKNRLYEHINNYSCV